MGIEMETEKASNVRKKGIYLLPNLLTTAGLFAGFYAIVAAMRGYFDTAAVAMFIAMIADAFDGRVARLVHASTDFGMQYDSLSDMVSFGIAPALVVYSWSLKGLGKIGWLIAFLFAACTALRLARFNIQSDETNKQFFIGLPCPSAAAVIAALVWCFNAELPLNTFSAIIIGLITLSLALLMVSNILFRSFKEIDFKGRTSFISLLVVVMIFIAISLNPPLVLLIIFGGYACSGPSLALFRLIKKAKKKRERNQNG